MDLIFRRNIMVDNNSEDKRLNQDRIERDQKANGSSGMLVAGVIILLAVVLAIYLYQRPAVTTTPAGTDMTTGTQNTTATSPENQTTTNSQTNASQQNVPATNTTTTTTP
jgi:cytoskeletal protein RodZ